MGILRVQPLSLAPKTGLNSPESVAKMGSYHANATVCGLETRLGSGPSGPGPYIYALNSLQS